ncbi:hypothetical protein L1887_09929 [Cichorium endivia]|nr:hypothetical protein L1887_09929 [Cichorium endivia]
MLFICFSSSTRFLLTRSLSASSRPPSPKNTTATNWGFLDNCKKKAIRNKGGVGIYEGSSTDPPPSSTVVEAISVDNGLSGHRRWFWWGCTAATEIAFTRTSGIESKIMIVEAQKAKLLRGHSLVASEKMDKSTMQLLAS